MPSYAAWSDTATKPSSPAVTSSERMSRLLLASPVLWAAVVVIGPHGLVGIDVYRAFGIAWVGGNFLVGLAVLAAGLWASRSARLGSSRLWRGLGDDLTGRRLAAASGALDDLAEFEREG
jgi:hypothetical protein